MDDDLCRRFFLQPTPSLQRRYEVLRAFFVEHRLQANIAAQFGLTLATVQSLVRDFRPRCGMAKCPPFCRAPLRPAGRHHREEPANAA